MSGAVEQTDESPGAAEREPSAEPEGRSATSGRERAAAFLQRAGAASVLALVLLGATLAFPNFATSANLSNVAVQVSFLAIVALGMTFVIISGGIDLSVGSVYALGGVLAAYASRWGPLAGLLVPLVACAAIGLVQGLLVARAHLAPFIVTLAGLLGVRGLVLAVTSEGRETYLIEPEALRALGQADVLGLRLPAVIAIVLFALGIVLLNRTRFGTVLFAIGGSENAAVLMGLPVARATTLVYVLSGTLSGLAGVLLAARSSSGVPIVGVGFELDAIAAVVIGGTLLTGGAGSVLGTLCGVLLLGVIQNMINLVGSLPSAFQAVVSGLFLIVVVVVQTTLSRTRRLPGG